MEQGISKTQIVKELTRSPHGKLGEYVPIAQRAAREEPEFYAHLIAYDRKVGQVNDAHVALPVIALSADGTHDERVLKENALAHLATLGPRELVRALDFAKELQVRGRGTYQAIPKTVEAYLRAREIDAPWFERTALYHRASLKRLYARAHVKPSPFAEDVLFQDKAPAGSVFATVRNLRDMSVTEAAGTILERRIPFLVAKGALGEKAKDPTLVLALIERMSPTELVTNTKALEKLGIKTDPALRAAYKEALAKAASSKKASFKTTRAAQAQTDTGLREALHATQEKQIDALGRIEGSWLVLGDRSGSMELAIEVARVVAAALARAVKERVHLVFFDTQPRYVDATGKTYEQLLAETRLINANGGTSIGCGLQYAVERGLEVNGIAIISDAEENQPPSFAPMYKRYCEKIEKQPPVYLYKIVLSEAEKSRLRSVYNMATGRDTLTPGMHAAGYDLPTFEITTQTDYYALPALINTMRANRYSLVDDVMATPLLTLAEALKRT